MIVRQATVDDAAAMARLLNDIIALGGTTAHEVPKSVEAVRSAYVDEAVAAVVAEDNGVVIGWQSVGLWQGEGHVGTFVQPGIQAKGIGVAMFALTLDIVQTKGVTALIASIRADNMPGLAYYAKLGFVDTSVEPDFALSNGQIVGRVHRRFDV